MPAADFDNAPGAPDAEGETPAEPAPGAVTSENTLAARGIERSAAVRSCGIARRARVRLDRLVSYPGNPRRGDVDAIRASLRAHGKRGATCVEVSKEANDRYFQRVLSRMGGTGFFNNHCETANSSYYFDARGDAPGLRPNTSIETWWRSGHYPSADYDFRTVRAAMPSRIAERA